MNYFTELPEIITKKTNKQIFKPSEKAIEWHGFHLTMLWIKHAPRILTVENIRDKTLNTYQFWCEVTILLGLSNQIFRPLLEISIVADIGLYNKIDYPRFIDK